MGKIANNDDFLSIIQSLIERYISRDINKYELKEQLKSIVCQPSDEFANWFLKECGFDTKKYNELTIQKLLITKSATDGGSIVKADIAPETIKELNMLKATREKLIENLQENFKAELSLANALGIPDEQVEHWQRMAGIN